MFDEKIIILDEKVKDLGGFSVNRVLPSSKNRMVGPWIFFDHAGPASFEKGEGIDVRPHPHINLSTVTYLFEGEIYHRDSLGTEQIIKPGDINLMISGKGITHSERSTDSFRDNLSKLHALQLWLALPENYEEIEPEFNHYPKTSIPEVNENGVEIRVLIGSAYGVTSPVKTFCETLYLESYLKEGDKLKLPECEEIAVYVVSGSININGNLVNQRKMAIFKNSSETLKILANEKTQIAVIGGENIGNRYIEWNFVSSKKERIEQAKSDWQNGNFKKVINDEDEYIPLPKT